MSVKIEPLLRSEVSVFAKICQSAFADGIGAVLFSGGAAACPTTLAAVTQEYAEEFDHSGVRFLKAEDHDGNIVAVAKWLLYLREQTPDELEKTLRLPQPVNKGFEKEKEPIYRILYQNRRELMGLKPFICLCYVATRPGYQRRGAGRKLVEWGMRQADELQLPVYLEATPAGMPLYGSLGFEAMKEVRFEMAQFNRIDLSGVDINTVMIRQPTRSKGNSVKSFAKLSGIATA